MSSEAAEKVGDWQSSRPTPSETFPGNRKFRFDENFTSLADPITAAKWPRHKFIPLNRNAERYLSIGGEIRQSYELAKNPGFGADPEDDKGVWLQRYTAHLDAHLNNRFRIFTQLYSAFANGREGGASPVDENKLRFQNAFFEYSQPTTEQLTLKLRVGRQELEFGSGRLVDVSEGLNVRRTFDAGRLNLASNNWNMSLFASRPIISNSGSFDDDTNSEVGLWGFYATGESLHLIGGSLDIYFLGYQNDAASFAQGTAREDRSSVGARSFGNAGRWDWNWEALYQFGEFGRGDIRAWTLATDTGYTWEDAAWTPRLAINANIASGDKDADDDDLETFNPLFPRGNYFSSSATLGPYNFFNVQGFLSFTPVDYLAITVNVDAFWRKETEDGVYRPNGQLLRPVGDSDERFVSLSTSLSAVWRISRSMSIAVTYEHLEAGAYIREVGPSDDINYFETVFQWRF